MAAYGDMQDAIAKRMGGKKKLPKPAEGGDEGVTVEVDGPAESDDGGGMSSYEDVEKSAASDAFDAVKSGSLADFQTALSQFVEACVKRTKGEEG